MREPPNRARLELGVGERVRLTFSLGVANWTQDVGDGQLSSPTGATVIYRAPNHGQWVTVSAKGGGCTATIHFKIIAPQGVRMWQINETLHQRNRPDIGMELMIYILPDTVNFHSIEQEERDVPAEADGIYACKKGKGHHPGAPLGASQRVRPGFGTRIDGYDYMYSHYCSQNAGDGRMCWQIPNWYRVRGRSWHWFKTVQQLHTCNAAGNLYASKGGAEDRVNYGDPSSGNYMGSPFPP